MDIKSLFKGEMPSKLIAATMVITVAALIWLSWNLFDFYRTMQTIQRVYLRTEQLRGAINTYDEILGSSARIAALTGDLSWQERYKTYQKKLNLIVKESRRLAPELQTEVYAKQIDDAYGKLTEMEDRAFELVGNEKLKEARSILFSYEYMKQKQLYNDGANNYIAQMKANYDKTLSAKKRKDILSIMLIMFVLAASIGTGTLAMLQQQAVAAVAQLKRSQSALLTSASRLRQIIDNAPMPLLIANPENHQIIVANQAFCELVGYTFEKLLNMKATDLSADPAQDIKDVVITLRGGEKTAKRPIKWKKADGTVYDVVVSANMTEYSGQPVYLATAYDIMERKHVESEMKKHHVHVEDQVKKRTTEMEKKMKEMEEFHKASLADEARIMALKKEIEDLKKGS